MENYDRFYFDGEGTLETPDPTKDIVIEYHAKKAFTGVMWIGIFVSGIVIAVGFIYALATVFMMIIETVTK